MAYKLAEAAANEAVALDERMAEAHAVLATVREFAWDWSAAEFRYLQAIENNPNDSLTRHWYGTFLGQVGRLSDSLDQSLVAVRLDPVSPARNNRIAWAYMTLGQNELAEQYLGIAEEWGLRDGFGAALASWVLLRRRAGEEELTALKGALAASETDLGEVTSLLEAAEDRAAVTRIVELVSQREDLTYVQLQNLFAVSAILPQPDLALDLLERMSAERTRGFVGSYLWFPEALPVRQHPRFPDIARRIGLLDYWNQWAGPDLWRV